MTLVVEVVEVGCCCCCCGCFCLAPVSGLTCPDEDSSASLSLDLDLSLSLFSRSSSLSLEALLSISRSSDFLLNFTLGLPAAAPASSVVVVSSKDGAGLLDLVGVTLALGMWCLFGSSDERSLASVLRPW